MCVDVYRTGVEIKRTKHKNWSQSQGLNKFTHTKETPAIHWQTACDRAVFFGSLASAGFAALLNSSRLMSDAPQSDSLSSSDSLEFSQ